MVKKNSKVHLCSQCVNWLELKENEVTCDFDHFADVPFEKAELYVAELFDCEDFEPRED